MYHYSRRRKGSSIACFFCLEMGEFYGIKSISIYMHLYSHLKDDMIYYRPFYGHIDYLTLKSTMMIVRI